MSEDVKINLAKTSAVIGGLAGIFGLVGAWFVIPYRVEANEKRLDKIEAEQRVTRELLVRIDENVKVLKERAAKQP